MIFPPNSESRANSIPGNQLPYGIYIFELIDNLGETISITNSYHFNPIPIVSEDSMFPEDNAYYTGKSVIFKWDPIEDGGTYYSPGIYAINSSFFFYGPPCSEQSTAQLPEDINLPTGCTFRWLVGAFDGEFRNLTNNKSFTGFKTFTLNPNIRGRVTDEETGEPIYGVTVEAIADEIHFETTTNNIGYYEFNDISEGEWNIKVRHKDYKTENENVYIIENEVSDQNFELEPK